VRLRPQPCQAHAKWGTVAHFSVHFYAQTMSSALLLSETRPVNHRRPGASKGLKPVQRRQAMKMRQWKILAMVIGALVMIAGEAWAQGPVGRRQARQSQRIAQGVRSGQVSAREHRVLKREQKHIQKFKTRAFADGRVSPKERARLRRMQDRAGGHIYKAKHNRAHSRLGTPQSGALYFRNRSVYDCCVVRVGRLTSTPSWSLGWRFVLR
jgi:hypothetical protein